jgi:hypothetical protein
VRFLSLHSAVPALILTFRSANGVAETVHDKVVGTVPKTSVPRHVSQPDVPDAPTDFIADFITDFQACLTALRASHIASYLH